MPLKMAIDVSSRAPANAARRRFSVMMMTTAQRKGDGCGRELRGDERNNIR